MRIKNGDNRTVPLSFDYKEYREESLWQKPIAERLVLNVYRKKH